MQPCCSSVWPGLIFTWLMRTDKYREGEQGEGFQCLDVGGDVDEAVLMSMRLWQENIWVQRGCEVCVAVKENAKPSLEQSQLKNTFSLKSPHLEAHNPQWQWVSVLRSFRFVVQQLTYFHGYLGISLWVKHITLLLEMFHNEIYLVCHTISNGIYIISLWLTECILAFGFTMTFQSFFSVSEYLLTVIFITGCLWTKDG